MAAQKQTTDITPTVNSADDLISSCKLHVTKKFVDEVGKSLYFRELATGGIDVFIGMNAGADGTASVSKKVVLDVLQNTICTEDGILLFGDADGRKKLEDMPWTKVQAIFTVACNCLGMTKDQVEEKKSS